VVKLKAVRCRPRPCVNSRARHSGVRSYRVAAAVGAGLGGYRVQGRDAKDAQRILSDARSLQAAGAELLVVECVPASLGRDITQALDIPVIGIGAGPDCDAQVLVLYDMLGITPAARGFVKDFMLDAGSVQRRWKDMCRRSSRQLSGAGALLLAGDVVGAYFRSPLPEGEGMLTPALSDRRFQVFRSTEM